MDIQLLYYIIALILIIIGIAGIILPALPGLPFVYAGMFLAAWADDFQHLGWIPLTVLGVITLLSFLLDFLATLIGAKRVGASAKALWGSLLGTIVGLFFMPFGIFIGPFIGALVGEYWHERDINKATKVGFGTWLGILIGVVLELTLAFGMIAIFILAWIY